MSAITSEFEYLWDQLHAMEPNSKLGGIYAFKPGYHSTRADNQANWPGNYSIQDKVDKSGPSDKAAAIDWTFPDAQAGNYSTISKYSKRLYDSGRDPDDHRLDGWREYYGQNDSDPTVEGYDFRYGHNATSDSSHLWHIHLSCDRDKVNSRENMDNLLSVLRGDDVAGTGIIKLKKGMTGTEVDGLQNVLRRAGFDPGDSGEYDQKTADAVLACRKSMGSSISNGNEVSGDGWAQIMAAMMTAIAKEHAGKDGVDGKDGLNAGSTVTITGTGVVELP
jgi:hypothetical protein